MGPNKGWPDEDLKKGKYEGLRSICWKVGLYLEIIWRKATCILIWKREGLLKIWRKVGVQDVKESIRQGQRISAWSRGTMIIYFTEWKYTGQDYTQCENKRKLKKKGKKVSYIIEDNAHVQEWDNIFTLSSISLCSDTSCVSFSGTSFLHDCRVSTACSRENCCGARFGLGPSLSTHTLTFITVIGSRIQIIHWLYVQNSRPDGTPKEVKAMWLCEKERSDQYSIE